MFRRGLRNIFRRARYEVAANAASGAILGFGARVFSMPKRKMTRQGSSRRVRFRRTRGLGYQVGRSLYRRTPQIELKAIDVAEFTVGFRTPGAGTSTSPVLNVPINGAELYQRVGRKIYMKSLQVRGFIYNVGTSLQDTGRILLIYDSQSNAAFPLVANIISDMNAAAVTSGSSMLNLNNRQRFSILRDHYITFPAVTNTAGVLTNGPSFNDTKRYSYEINWFIKLKGLEAVYNQVNGGTIADVASGSLFMLFVSDQVDATWDFKGTTRLRYYD